jgi:tetrahydrodipicolinate N-succinyltransferase-like protein
LNAERVEEIIAALDRGEVRVAEPDGDGWRVNAEAQEAILGAWSQRRSARSPTTTRFR